MRKHCFFPSALNRASLQIRADPRKRFHRTWRGIGTGKRLKAHGTNKKGIESLEYDITKIARERANEGGSNGITRNRRKGRDKRSSMEEEGNA